MSDEEKIAALIEAINGALNECRDEFEFTTGNAMDALFSVFMASAEASPNHSPAALLRMMTEAINTRGAAEH